MPWRWATCFKCLHNACEKHQFSATGHQATVTMPRQNSASGESDYDQDDILINKILNGAEEGEPLDFENIGDTVGKVDDAVDYENISDDDLLPDEESPGPSGAIRDPGETSDGDISDFMKEGEEGAGGFSEGDLDDLFGDSDLVDDKVELETEALDIDFLLGDLQDGISPSILAAADEEMLDSQDSAPPVDMDVEMVSPIRPKQLRPQDLVKQYFPDFAPHKILSFISLFQSKPTTLSIPHFDPPAVCVPTKKLEMAADDRGCFLGALTKISGESRGVIVIPREAEGMELDARENIENMSQEIAFERDLVLACEDWDSKVDAMMATPPASPKQKRTYNAEIGEDITHGSCSNKVSIYARITTVSFN